MMNPVHRGEDYEKRMEEGFVPMGLPDNCVVFYIGSIVFEIFQILK